MAAKPGKLVLVGFRVEVNTVKEAKALVNEGIEKGWWDERIKEHKMVALPKPRKCKHRRTEDIEREQFDWLQGKSRHWRETICRDCGATVNISDGWWE